MVLQVASHEIYMVDAVTERYDLTKISQVLAELVVDELVAPLERAQGLRSWCLIVARYRPPSLVVTTMSRLKS